jgi:hypothetical protein
MSERRVKFLACPVVIEEMRARLPEGLESETLDFQLHSKPENLKGALQEKIDANADYDVLVLGYGLCSQAVVGLRSERSTLVVPKVDDCISILLGSRAAYLEQMRIQPGTVYTSKGWIESRDTPMGHYERMTAKYGEERAKRVIATLYKHYKRIVFINTGVGDIERYRQYTLERADQLNLDFVEMEGSPALFDKMVNGVWNEEFVVVEPGREISFLDFAAKS